MILVPNMPFSFTRTIKRPPKAPPCLTSLNRTFPGLGHMTSPFRQECLGKWAVGGHDWYTPIKIHSLGWDIFSPQSIGSQPCVSHSSFFLVISVIRSHMEQDVGKYLRGSLFSILFSPWLRAQQEPGTPTLYGMERSHVGVGVFKGALPPAIHSQQAYLIPHPPSKLDSKTFWWLQSKQQTFLLVTIMHTFWGW